MSKMKNVASFPSPPPIGSVIRYGAKRTIELVSVSGYVRKDGRPSHILTWRADDGRVGTTGLSFHSVVWSKP